MSVQQELFESTMVGLEPAIERVFGPLCLLPTPALLTELPTSIQAHLAHVEAELRRNEFLDIESARKIADLLLLLLDAIEEYSVEQQRLIVGAARYFASSGRCHARHGIGAGL